MLKRYFGNREFYKMVAVLALPLLLQNAVSTFVNLLDNLMVGRLGTESMSGVSIVNQLIFVFNLCLFGGTGGAGIYGAQFYGQGNQKGVGRCLRFNILLCAGFTVVGILVLRLLGEPLIGAFLHQSDASGSLELTRSEGLAYLRIMLWGLPPFALSAAYVSILRVTGDNRLPMQASVLAIGVNLVFNWLLIYGMLGFPRLGVRGAAIATVLSRYVELGRILLGTHGKKEPPAFLRGVYTENRIPPSLCRDIIKKSLPLLANETLWSLGLTTLTQCYSYRGLEAVAALNINSTVSNFFNTVLFTMGSVAGIILGNQLGAGELDKARSTCPRLIALSLVSCSGVAVLLFLAAPFAPLLYNTSPRIMELAAGLIRVSALTLPMQAVINCVYWALRSGGRTALTMLFDCAFTWLVSVSTAYLLIHCTALPLLAVFIIVSAMDAVKLPAGIILVRRGVWVRNLVADKAE